jgi:3-(3-hydroxy-phenyl)propionate hydroxylase
MDVFCSAGDAAHLNSPAGGMAMNSGLHNAASLVGHLLSVLPSSMIDSKYREAEFQ